MKGSQAEKPRLYLHYSIHIGRREELKETGEGRVKGGGKREVEVKSNPSATVKPKRQQAGGKVRGARKLGGRKGHGRKL